MLQQIEIVLKPGENAADTYDAISCLIGLHICCRTLVVIYALTTTAQSYAS